MTMHPKRSEIIYNIGFGTLSSFFVQANIKRKRFHLFFYKILFIFLVSLQCGFFHNSQQDLLKAAGKGTCDDLELLLRRGASLDHANKDGFTPVHLAAKAQDSSCLSRIARGNHFMDQPTEAGNTPLFTAAAAGNAASVSILIEQKINLQHKNRNNQNALEVAWDKQKNKQQNKELNKVIDLLVKAGIRHPEASKWIENGVRENKASLVANGIRTGGKVNTVDAQGYSLLMNVAKNGSMPIVELLVRSRANVRFRSKNGQTAVSVAFAHRHNAIGNYLISKGGSNPIAEAKLIESAARGNIDGLAQAISQGADVNAFDSEGISAFLKAIQNDQADAARYLLSKGSRVNKADKDGYLPLHWAAQIKNPELLQVVLSKKNDLDAKNNFGYTALILASSKGYLENVKTLVLAKASLHIEADRGGTPAYWAKEHEHFKVLDYLKEKGAIDPENNEALTDAIKADNIDLVKTALAAKVDVNARNKDGYSPIMFAANKGNMAVLQMLLDRGAKVNVQEAEGYTPLMMAAWHSHLDALRLLLKKGAKQSLYHNKGRTTLMIAAWKGSPDILAELLRSPYEINRQDKEGFTALMFAVLANSPEKVSLLLSKGANRAIRNYDKINALQIAKTNSRDDIASLLMR